jgi:hypothetical protein
MMNFPGSVFWFALTLLTACAYKRPAGQWTTIDAPGVYFSGVELSEGAKDSVYPELCVEAQNEIQTQLLHRLPAHIKPLAFHAPQKQKKVDVDKTVFNMTITKCEVDAYQWDASFTFYLTLDVRVTLKENNRTLVAYSMKTYEQLHTDIPNPSFDFTFEEPVARTLILFEKGRVWIPNENQ